MSLDLLAALLVAVPLASAAVLLVLGRATDRWGHWLGVLASAASFVIGAVLALELLGRDAEARVLDVTLGRWFDAGQLAVDLGLRVDPLSITFVLLVTFVGTLIHVYSVAYMEHDASRRRFFAYLNLFVAAMLLLVLADSYLLLFVGWEGVGLASYLLIGFWNHNTAYAVAGKKAFVANRVGDIGLIVAMGLMLAATGSVGFTQVHAAAAGGAVSEGWLTAIGLMLLLAACGKSAQVPLQSWLGDAMAGPTPVSALIHAATMVTAGVYLVVRSAPVFDGAPTAQLVVVVVGAVTLVYGAVVGCAKDDLKKALAASTMSQIGYMMLAAGLGPVGYAYAIFHLVTHGFFKAGLFLGAGSVMHAMADSVDMRRFGGLARYLKVTVVTFGLGWLAILGVPPFAGFFSKDKIIEAAFVPVDGQPWRAWVFGAVTLLGAGVTAFYMSRLFFMTFFGRPRWDVPEEEARAATARAAGARTAGANASGAHASGAHAAGHHPHEAPALMRWPMIVLAAGSVALGLVLATTGFTTWLEPVTGHAEHEEPVLSVPVITTLTLLAVGAGLVLAYLRYVRDEVPVAAPAGSPLTRAARADLYQDAVNDAVLVGPGRALTGGLVVADRTAVDGAAVGVGRLAVGSGALARRVQTGLVRSYAATTLLGVVVLAGVVLALQA
ncbi:NADH-quinone oxidoreductase subunit L [Cellulomonas marina]|uniref:NADH-quinone oxidoreductase subunit L n=1 Tax=Cellulomonas marina TaxID=988821 RepID=A0A1I0XKW3_9CELL|nr:NADH-quinone oxidoreductase subunit L [Cellulomonas marina]GIG30107.1 NADH-quinone oxidoreductase subunit L [Cellulomonas marina]SFB01357.1 NADH-quinone oxidoreductase subunit L [Cellulomonas marina]